MTQAGPPETVNIYIDKHHRAARLISFPTTTVNVAVENRQNIVEWWAFTETTGAAGASLTVFDGQDATGQEAATINLLPGESIRETAGLNGLRFTRGVFVQINSGSVRGTFGLAR